MGLIQRSKILVLASHSTTLADRFYSRALWLDSGVIRDDGPVANVVRNYIRCFVKIALALATVTG